ncbi:aspartyl-tRNA(Asn)/glutamyl-tRNA(Gln) amidotransferase subunit B [Desulfosalsimonas propionicica]|uniref:Aspartyl/glutamyl-tRNA(Asn/Gln) amidotransferase subunit B n=1 Tax=Desulfosalsimonas propionicica TaxID=332175 RepID=A0A7W0C609_9BACT|nr:Asp-tRNA(Asn)/Glu-tRNA(Gln) amidotransferase subunit GatB [Desulfosalsimonas propionicica]MBA2879854.1 aspartyl-tRNA(Asn)/glutamyl-tRNA(Gln) amidotransferase subunit B [Desulfosalsimonas propionicica]
MRYEPVIGLEVHAQLKTRTKIFCGCSTAFGAPPNTHVCPVCLGMPGVLPVLNRSVVEYAMKMALATGCQVEGTSRFARKNYFYPDLPKGYQISQYELPIARNGCVDISLEDGTTRRIGITRIHMEEDAGKLIHDPARPVSYVDYNRTGVPLIEIVSEPDLRSPAEAGAYLRQLRAVLRYLDISDGNMEEGSFRCDANVSVRPQGQEPFGTRTELKNLNSFKFVEKALAWEIDRQIEVLEQGGEIVQETRLWDTDKGRTISMRGKEEAHDYRYFPDPDLVPLVIDSTWIDQVQKDLPELPDQRRARFIADFGLPEYDAGVLTASREFADYFEQCLGLVNRPKLVSNWMMGELTGLLNARGINITESPISASRFSGLIELLDTGVISGKIAKTVFDEMADSEDEAKTIVEKKGLVQVSDHGEIEAIVDRVVADHPDEAEKYRQGRKKLMGFFVGQVMKESRGKANPQVVNEVLKKRLG